MLLAACGRSDRAILDDAQAMMNQRRYGDAVQLLEKELPAHSSPELKTELGYAYLGLSGIELLELARHVSFLKSFKNVELDESSITQNCPQIPLEGEVPIADKNFKVTCLPMIKIAGFPAPDHPALLKALSIFEEVYPDPANTSEDINLLLAVVQMGVAIANYDLLVQAPDGITSADLSGNRELQIQAASFTVKYFKRTFNVFFSGVHRLFFSYGKVRRFLAKFMGKPLLTIGTYTYYGTAKISFEDFFQFLVASGQDAVRKQAAAGQGAVPSISQFSASVVLGLRWMRIQIAKGQEDFLSAYFAHFLTLGQDVLPGRLNVKPTIPSDLGFYLKMDPLPKELKRAIEAVKKTWSIEDARAIFDVADEIKTQYYTLNEIQVAWHDFWAGLDNPSQARLKAEMDEFRQGVPVVDIDPSALPDIKIFQAWYQKSSQQLNALKDRVEIEGQGAGSDTGMKHLPALIDRTEAWINSNLW